ncbi:TetR/AcrR family transcriptional regulator [Pusillimonas sp. CC-YST705]|uniref:TetR/AcrR family transcriptional regulator n=1 Tax=Mesopusillimonas faecipullorum TaxID=2755040 RepID=A0ABS8CEI9_9BURK|nr:TetR/AcrR family transcriptional regulator [Mesopusillimonas faecipullorum]MCB5364460.1 TetR/AcrR family transcriptional regulator [Mesopusillimonas faecipullorum]
MARPSSKTNVVPQAILEAASNLFIKRGYEGTSMQDIAQELEISRSALYYYFKNKEEILGSLTEGLTIVAERLASQVVEKSKEPEEALRELVRQHAKLILLHPVQFRVVDQAEGSLPDNQRKIAESARRILLQKFTDVIQRGVDSGRFRLVNARVAAFAIIGMCNWTAWWFKADGAKTTDEIAEILADFGLHALERIEVKKNQAVGLHESLRVLEENLSQLKAVIDTTP